MRLNCVGTHILFGNLQFYGFWIWHLDILSPEFLTSLWEMWTAAQGWGPPRPGEAGWANLLLSNTAVFKRAKLKRNITPPPHEKKTLRCSLLYLIEAPKLRLPLMSNFNCMCRGPAFLILNVFFFFSTVFWQSFCGPWGIRFRENRLWR